MDDSGGIFEACSIEEKRELLKLSRIRLGIDTKYPREKATDSIVERGIFGCSPDKPCSEEEINNTIAASGLMNGLRKNELRASLERLRQERRIQSDADGKFSLSRDRTTSIGLDIRQANDRFDKIVTQVYKPIIDRQNRPIYRKFFLDFISVVFARFGDQWIKSLSSQALPQDFLKESDIDIIFRSIAKKHILPKAQLESIKKLSLKFFVDIDPDYNYLKFNLAQSIYITKILGIDTPIDLFSQEIFSGAFIILDTNLVFASLLPVSKYNTTFKELWRICKRTGIELAITTVTKDEVDRVTQYLEQEAINLFDEIPEKIIPKVRGIFFESYIAEKGKNTNFCVSDLFKPFHNLKDTLKSVYQINIIDSTGFDNLMELAKKETRLQDIFNATSLDVRKRGKGKESILHDLFHYLLIESERVARNKKSWFLTLDTSLPYVATKLQKEGDSPFCFKLDVLMQCFSPFITTEQEVYNFSDVFSKLIANQLFPSSQIFDVRDFVFFNDIGIKLSEMSEEDIEEALCHIKKYVLKGKVYSHTDFDKVAYEVKRLFSARVEKDEMIRKQLDRIVEMEKKHKLELSNKETEMRKLEEDKNVEIRKLKEEKEADERTKSAKKESRIRLTKIIVFGITALSALFILIYLTYFFAEGKNLFQKILNSWKYYALWAAIFGLYLKWVEKKS